MNTSTGERSPPRVLLVIGGLEAGGSETQLTEFVLRAHPHRLHATVVTFGGAHTDRRARLEAHDVRVIALGANDSRGLRYAALTAARLLRRIHTVRPDVVYAWLEESALFAAPTARLTGVPLVVARRNVIGASFERRVRRLAWVVTAAERSAAQVTVNSEAGRVFAESRGITADRITVIHNGHPGGPAEPLPPPAPFVFGYLSRFRPEKGHHRLLNVLERVATPGGAPPWRVRLGGDGELLETIIAAAAARGLSDRLDLVGHVTDVPGFWRKCHVAVLLSDHEGQPNALIEAAMAGRAAIATRVGGTPEVVAPRGGVLVDPDNLDAAAAAFRRYLASPALAAADGQAARTQAQARFAMAASVEAQLDVLNAVRR